MAFRIVVETREQTPWTFPKETKRVEIVHKKLDVGDYSVEGYEHLITIERKSLTDMFGTYSNRLSPFTQRLQEMRRFRHKVIVIECNATAFMKGPRYYHSTKLPAIQYAGMINTFLIGQWITNGIPYVFMPRGLAQRFAVKWLRAGYDKFSKEK